MTSGNVCIGIDPQDVLSSLSGPVQQKACFSPSAELVQWPTLHGRDVPFFSLNVNLQFLGAFLEELVVEMKSASSKVCVT